MMGAQDMQNVARDPFAPLRSSSVALLTTFRRSSAGVGTPVGITVVGGKAYFTTWTTTGKVKRMRNNPHVTLAPCTRAGKVTGPTVEGVARRLTDDEAERMRAIHQGGLWGTLWLLLYRLQRRQPVMYEVSPVAEGATPDREENNQHESGR